MIETLIALFTRAVVALESIAVSLSAAKADNPAASGAEAAKDNVKPDAEKDKSEAQETRAGGNARNSRAPVRNSRSSSSSSSSADDKSDGKDDSKSDAVESDASKKPVRAARSPRKVKAEDTPEQKELREQLFADLTDLGGLAEKDPECRTDIDEVFQRHGVTSVSQLLPEQLEDAANDINDLINKYFQAQD